MKYLVGFGGAIIVLIIIKSFLVEICHFTVSDFLTGWLCNMGFTMAKDEYYKYNSK